MNSASLYQRANNVQRHDAKQILKEYGGVIQWRSDGHDRLLDIGCGSGNVLMDYVYPMMPGQYAELVGTDISEKMIGYANKAYGAYKRTQFRVMDIATETIPEDFSEKFDHVTSFYCLHWVQNQRRALENIYKMLRREGGDCLLIFLASNHIYDVYEILAKDSKWSSYMSDVNDFISPLHYCRDPGEEFSKVLDETGFVDYSVEIRNELYVYEGVNTVKDNIRAICPFLERIPIAEHEDFLDDIVDTVASLNLREQDPETMEYKFISPYKLVVAYARKPSEFLNNFVIEERSAKGLD